jgi:hypothetical protein
MASESPWATPEVKTYYNFFKCLTTKWSAPIQPRGMNANLVSIHLILCQLPPLQTETTYYLQCNEPHASHGWILFPSKAKQTSLRNEWGSEYAKSGVNSPSDPQCHIFSFAWWTVLKSMQQVPSTYFLPIYVTQTCTWGHGPCSWFSLTWQF